MNRLIKLGRRGVLAGFCMVGGALLMACTPEHNWREIRSEPDGFVAMFPARPDTMARSVALADDLTVTMSMHGAQVNGVVYAVATARLPATDAALPARALAAMQAHMVRNIAGQQRPVRAASVPRGFSSAAGRGVLAAEDIVAEGRVQGAPAQLFGRFVAAEGRVWQAVVVGPRPHPEHVTLFLDSLRIAP